MKKYEPHSGRKRTKAGHQGTQTLLRRGTQAEGQCDSHQESAGESRQQSSRDELDQERINRKDGAAGRAENDGSPDTGGVAGELIADCLEQIAENEALIKKMQARNVKLKEKVSRLQELNGKLTNPDE